MWDSLVEIWPDLARAMRETFRMVGIAMIIGVLLGTPVGVVLNLTSQGGLHDNRWVRGIVGWIVNVVRSFPFIILLVVMIPVTRRIVGTTIGPDAAAVSLSVAAIPFFARLVEQNLRDVPRGEVEAAIACGASTLQVVRKVLLLEARSGLVLSLTTTIISFIAFSAMAGAVGGGGIGDLAIRFGYYRFDSDVMVISVVTLVLAVQVIQFIGTRLAHLLDHRG